MRSFDHGSDGGRRPESAAEPAIIFPLTTKTMILVGPHCKTTYKLYGADKKKDMVLIADRIPSQNPFESCLRDQNPS